MLFNVLRYLSEVTGNNCDVRFILDDSTGGA